MNNLTNEQLVKAREKFASIVRGLSQISGYEIVKDSEDSYSIKVELSAQLPDRVKLPSVVLGLPVHIALGGEPVEGKPQEIKPIEPVAPIETSSMVVAEDLPKNEDKVVFGSDSEGGEVTDKRVVRRGRIAQEE